MAKLALRDLVGYWEFHNRTEGKSPRTVDWYNQVLDLFERFLERETRSLLIDDIGEDEVRSFIAHLQQSPGRRNGSGPVPQGQSPETIQNRIRALKAFFAWLHREGYTETYRLERLKNYRVPQTMKEVLSEEEIGQVRKAVAVGGTKSAYRCS